MKQIKNILLLMLAIGCIALCGCTEDYDRGDIEDYVEETYQLDKFSVSKKAKEIVDEEEYTDYLWTVTLEDGSGIEFYVLDNYGWGMEWVTNYLCDNFNSAALRHLYKEYGGIPMFRLNTTEEEFYYSSLQAEFSNRKELSLLFEELEKFAAYAEENGYGTGISVRMEMQNILRNRCDYVVDDGDCIELFEDGVTEEDYEDALKEYLLTCLDYRFEEQLSEFTEEEIRAALKDYSCCIAISRGGKQELYDDLCANKYYYGISYGTLYEILKREGIEVEGDNWHYSFVGIDGSVYEISYDFCDYEYIDDEVRNGYYYLKDGERTPMNAYFYNHFRESEILEMTGLELEVREPFEEI